MNPLIWVVVALVVLALIVGAGSIRILKEYERGVVFRLGRLRPPLGAGVRFVAPIFDRMVRMDLRIVTLTIPPQEVITKDNVPARVNAVVLFRVVDSVKAVMEVENHAVATSQIAQTTLRSVVGRADLDTLLAHRQDLNEDLARTIAKQVQPWGIEVNVVEIKDVEIPEAMQRAMAREAEAERERRAKVISAHGELQASGELKQAADMLSQSPASLQLRYLQTLLELGADQNSTVVFPLPMDIIGPLLNRFAGTPQAQPAAADPASAAGVPAPDRASASDRAPAESAPAPVRASESAPAHAPVGAPAPASAPAPAPAPAPAQEAGSTTDPSDEGTPR